MVWDITTFLYTYSQTLLQISRILLLFISYFINLFYVYIIYLIPKLFDGEVFFGFKKSQVLFETKGYREEAKFIGYFNHRVKFDKEVRLR